MKPLLKIFSRDSDERGFSIVENLVAITILGIASVATIPLIFLSLNATGESRNQAAALAEVEGLVSDYKTLPFIEVLQKIASNVPSIQDGDTVTITEPLEGGRSSYTVTLTAIKSQSLGNPEAVRMLIEVTQRRGTRADRQYQFETIISQVS
ncbi:MAG: type II secretion system protein [Deltaproteobacteria bacterium]|nr:type II secretion system protein [Deltaproteobacteria bacterium]